MKWVLAASFLLTGCSRYADFTLPVLSGQPGTVEFEWDVFPTPIVTRGAAGSWDSIDALNPSIVVLRQGKLLNVYSGYDGKTWHTGIAESSDSITWTKKGKILSPDPSTWEGDYIAANGSAIYESGKFMYWYQAARVPQIGLATSSDAKIWKKNGDPVLARGPRGSWDEMGAADPYVIRVADHLYMYYLGQDRARRQRLGVARSRDGVTWEKYRGNPILELGFHGRFDDTGLGEPAVWSQHGWYWMLYTARSQSEERRLGLARSRNGVGWTRVTEEPVLSGALDWNSKVICDPHVLSNTNPLWVYFGGGNRPEPAENLNGQIGYATLKLSLKP